MIPPVLVLIRAGWLWLPVPLFLAWPLYVVALALAVVLLPLVPFRSMSLRQRVLFPFWVAGVIHALRGLVVDVGKGGGRRVCLSVI
jgi:hypothetical protein